MADNIQKLKFKKSEISEDIPLARPVKVTKMQHIVEIMSVTRPCDNLEKYQKLDKCRYIELESGEILEYQLNENRGQNIAGVKRTQKIIRNLINSNFSGGDNELFLTLTYRPNDDGTYMTDTKRLYTDYDLFMKRFRRKYKNIDYLCIVEPQGNGAWHCHVLVRFNNESSVFINNNEVLQPMWGQGYTKIKRIKNVDNIGAYLSAYLADLEVCQDNSSALLNLWEEGKTFNLIEKEIEDENGKVKSKKFLKGARLHLYPSGMNIYRHSRGILKPVVKEMAYNDAKKIVGSRKANYKRTINILSTDDSQNDKFINSITYEYYNLKR